MAYKIIAFDLDGTFLDDDKNIPEDNLQALKAASERGIMPVVATGRILEGIPEAIRALPFIRYYITVNGAYVYDAQERKTLYQGDIPVETAVQLCRYLDGLPVLYDCYQDNRGWMSAHMYDMAPEYFENEPHLLDLVHRLRTKVDDLQETLRERNRPVQKMQVYFKPQNNQERLRQIELIPELFPQLATSTSFKNNIEINSVEAGKGRALAALCRSLGIDISQSLAFGDGSNDIGMLRTAGLGVAMANADQQVKAAADICTGDNNQAGLAKMLWQILDGRQ